MTAAAYRHSFGRDVEAVDAGGDGGLQSGRHTDVGGVITAEVGTAIAVEHTAFGQITHHLLGEERVPGGLLGDPGGQARTDGSVPSSSAVNAAVCESQAAPGRSSEHPVVRDSAPRYSGR